MGQIVVVCGEWRFQKNMWLFFVDSWRGSRVIDADRGTSFEDFVSIVYEDFGFEKFVQGIELSYMLSKKVLSNLPQDTPFVIVGNNRQFQRFLDQCKEASIRLCVTLKEGKRNTRSSTVEDNVNDGQKRIKFVIEAERDDEEEDEEGDIFDCCDDSDGASEGDHDYSVYGKTEIEEEDENQTMHLINGTPPRKPNIPDDFQIAEMSALNVAVGQRYENKEALETRLKILSVIHHFDFDVEKSTSVLYTVKCWVKHCSWRLRASPIGAGRNFYVRIFVGEHTCSVTKRSERSRQGTYEILGQLYKDFVGGVGPSVLPSHVSDALQKRYHLKVDYWKAHRALRYARELVRGTPESGYEDLPTYLYQIRRANPGSYTRLVVDDIHRFKFLFIAFGASIIGFQYMRKVLVVDGTHLQGKYKGTLLLATAQDGNFGIFPIAFGVVDTENDESWDWFFKQLSTVIPDDRGLAIISDRHRAIGNAIGKVYPLATRGICTYHLYKNILQRFRGGESFRLVKKAANAYRMNEFNYYFEEIRHVNPALHAYLVKADVRYWTRVYFAGDRYNFTTTNIAESINKVLSDARSLPIMQLIDAIRSMLTRWFAERRKAAGQMKTVLTRRVEKMLAGRVERCRDLTVQEIDAHQFEVTYGAYVNVVNLTAKKCTCRMFDIDKIPCVHAIAAAEANKKSRIRLCHQYYTTSYLSNAYAASISPRDRASPVPAEVEAKLCLPPSVRQPPGRPKKSRYKSALEMALQKKVPRKLPTCSKCGQTGHNVRTCSS